MSTARFTAEQVAQSWSEALALWDVRVQLSPPEPHQAFNRKQAPGNEPLAYIDLVKRQVFVNFELLWNMGAAGSLMAVLAHEIGHHVRFPHTLGWDAELRALEQRLIPGLKQSLTNLFFDLQVNEVVGRTHAEQLCAVYRGFLRTQSQGEVSPLFFFYLALYEELWARPPGDLVPPARIEPMETAFPGLRAEAKMFVQTFYALTDMRLQFLYFCATFIRYIDKPDATDFLIPLAGDVPLPDEDDLDAAVHGGGRWDDVLAEARERGWLDASQDSKELDPLAAIARVTEHMPGKGGGKLRRALVGRHYRRLVDQYVLKLPSSPSRPEPYLRTTPESWEYGDDPSQIDWALTVLSQGPLAAVAPLRRELEADLPIPSEIGVPAVEIYLDTSGSMPNPEQSLNAMTLAAQVLAATALRKRATVRGIVYSDGSPKVSPWMYDEETARDFLLHYIGGGTMFPFKLFTELARERPDVLRIIISDTDFLANVSDVANMKLLAEGVRRSRLVVAFLAAPNEFQVRQALKPVLEDRRFRLVLVQWMSEFGPAAAALSEALLEN